ncbi:MAG: hypothetical protein U1F83_06260 [Verrucomicrobiota bacterium]
MRTIQFIIGKLEYVGSKKFLAAGRNCLDDLRQGDRLKVAAICGGGLIEVTVNELTMYGRQVTSVPSGLTAGLILENEMAQHFHLGTELKGEIA